MGDRQQRGEGLCPMSDSDECSLNDDDLANVSSGSLSDDSEEDVKQVVLICKIDYKAQKATQVSFKKGARVIKLGEPKAGWFRGRLESSFEEGVFPSQYCLTEEAWEAFKEAAVEDEVLMVCKCLVDYTGRPDAQELSFKTSDRIEVIDTKDPARWKARFRGKVGFVDPKHLEEDKGFTIRRAAAQKQASRDQFANRRNKEARVLANTKKSGSQKDMEHIRKEQEKLQQEREQMQAKSQQRKEARLKRDSAGSFGDRMKARSGQKKLEAAAKKQQEKKDKVADAVGQWAGE